MQAPPENPCKELFDGSVSVFDPIVDCRTNGNCSGYL